MACLQSQIALFFVSACLRIISHLIYKLHLRCWGCKIYPLFSIPYPQPSSLPVFCQVYPNICHYWFILWVGKKAVQSQKKVSFLTTKQGPDLTRCNGEEVKSAYKPRGPSGQSLSRFPCHKANRRISTSLGWDAIPS